jgi:hypothetical protein
MHSDTAKNNKSLKYRQSRSRNDILEVIYNGKNYDLAIERELKRLNKQESDFKTIICYPFEMRAFLKVGELK